MSSLRLDTEWTDADLDAVHGFISRSYWAEGIPRELMRKAMEGSLNFILRGEEGGQLLAYARVISDCATFAYLCDVFVPEAVRGRGHAKRLMAELMQHPSLSGLRRFTLFTQDAHALYAGFGFAPLAAPERAMEIARPGLYLKSKES
ncbi:GNAT family N-acetyltransferase [Burkholderiaceae bacterium UC74_6]